MLPGMAWEGVDPPLREGDGRCRLWEVLLELDSSECERFDGSGRDGPAKVATDEDEEDAETGDLCSLEGAARECDEELGLVTILCRWSNSFRCSGSCGTGK